MGNQTQFLLNFSSNLTDVVYEVVIFDRCWNQLYRSRTTQNSLQICCECEAFVVQVSAQSGVKTQTISRFLTSFSGVLSMNFNFNLLETQQEFRQIFSLSDKTYGLPIKNAKLILKPR